MLVPHDPSGSGIDFRDFQQGFSVVSGKRAEAYLFNSAEAHEKELSDQGMIFDDFGNEISHLIDEDRTTGTFDEKLGAKITLALGMIAQITEGLIVNVGGKELSFRRFLVNYLENRIQKLKIDWVNEANDRDGSARATNFTMINEIAGEFTQDILRLVNLCSKLIARREELREYWGEHTDTRFNFIISRFAPEYNKILNTNSYLYNDVKDLFTKDVDKDALNRANEQMRTFTGPYTLATVPAFMNALRTKTKVFASKEEFKLVMSTFGLLSIGFDPQFPLVDLQLDDNFGSFAKAISTYNWWSIASRRLNENRSDGQEPLDLAEEDSAYGAHFTNDFDDQCRVIENGSGEAEFNFCFNTYEFTNDKGEIEHRYYRQSDYNEFKMSLERSTALANKLQDLFLKGTNIHKWRDQDPQSDTFQLYFLQVVEYYSGKRFTLKQVVMDGETISCKKMSRKVLTDWHERQLSQLFWGAYRIQQEQGIIKTVSKVDRELATQLGNEIPC